VYKPIYLEAQAAVALAMYLRAGKTPPSGLLNSSVTDPANKATVPSVLLAPEWVTPTNMSTTIIKDKYVTTAKLCSGTLATECKKYGIT
jgi:D-xylose transport system substrate-binding protein